MVEFSGVPSIVIDAEPGLYTFGPESATGKTYLYTLLKARQMAGMRVVAYTYWDYKVNLSLSGLIASISPELVFVDRLDCFVQDKEVVSTLLSVSDIAVVLTDIKQLAPPPFGCKFASIELSKDRIEVIG